MLGLCPPQTQDKVGEKAEAGGRGDTTEVQHQGKNHFEVLAMKSVKIILDEDRPVYIPRKENVLHKQLPWTA